MRPAIYLDARNGAIVQVHKAIKSGLLPRLRGSRIKCVDCGRKATCYDHRDYGKPLEVVPVCMNCNFGRGPAMLKGAWIPNPDTLPYQYCNMCKAQWEPRKKTPIQCPRCKSLRWNDREAGKKSEAA